MTLNDLEWPFYVKFSLLRTTRSEIIFNILTVEYVIPRDQRRCAEADRYTQNTWDPRKKTADLS